MTWLGPLMPPGQVLAVYAAGCISGAGAVLLVIALVVLNLVRPRRQR